MFKTWVLLALLQLVYSREIEIENNHEERIWVVYSTVVGPNITGGFALSPFNKILVSVVDNWSGHFCARVDNCKNDGCEVKCEGAGIPPMTIAQIFLNVSGFGVDHYFVSLVHGYNFGVQIQPYHNVQDPKDRYRCGIAGCKNDLNLKCPIALRVHNDSGHVVGCSSSCSAFNTDQYCCRSKYDTLETCKASNWTVNSANYFKSNCPEAFSYLFDNKTRVYNCNDTVYRVTFFSSGHTQNNAQNIAGTAFQQLYILIKLQLVFYIFNKYFEI